MTPNTTPKSKRSRSPIPAANEASAQKQLYSPNLQTDLLNQYLRRLCQIPDTPLDSSFAVDNDQSLDEGHFYTESSVFTDNFDSVSAYIQSADEREISCAICNNFDQRSVVTDILHSGPFVVD